MNIITRAEARVQGLIRYFTGKPCKRGHLSERHTSTGNCLECFRVTQRDREQSPERKSYREEWNAKNRERVRSYTRKEHMTPEAWERYKEQVRVSNMNRDKRVRTGTLSPDIYQRLHAAQCGQCVYCRISLDEVTPHLDHIMPLALDGSNTDDNVQLLCPTCNTSKGSTHPAEYEARIGYARQHIKEICQ